MEKLDIIIEKSKELVSSGCGFFVVYDDGDGFVMKVKSISILRPPIFHGILLNAVTNLSLQVSDSESIMQGSLIVQADEDRLNQISRRLFVSCGFDPFIVGVMNLNSGETVRSEDFDYSVFVGGEVPSLTYMGVHTLTMIMETLEESDDF